MTELQSTVSNTEVKAKVSRVSVCTGELCQCQGEEYEYTGGAADAALEKLQGLDLPFPVDDTGCMGVCGMGTMIAIDYEGGRSVLTDGLEEAMKELGLKTESTEVIPEPVMQENVVNTNTDTANVAKAEVQTASVEVQSKPTRELTDVRERMRAAAKEEEQQNPWLNMASYLAKKAMDKVTGKE